MSTEVTRAEALLRDAFGELTEVLPPMRDEDLVGAGRRYLAAGVGPLVPLVGKDPSHYGTDWQNRGITDPVRWAEVVASDTRYTNIGWVQGHGTVALDFDYPDKAGEPLRAVGRQGAKNPTRRGRGHRIFATEEVYGSSTVGFPTAGWGEVRGKGGQIVIWGPHPEDPEAFYSYDEAQEIPPAPPELLEWLSGVAVHANAARVAELNTALGELTENNRPRALEGIRTRVEHITEVLAGRKADDRVKAARHDNLVDLACWASREALAGLYPLAEAHELIAKWWQTLELPAHRSPVDVGRNEFTAAWCWGLAQAHANPARIEAIRDPIGELAGSPPANVDPETGEVLEGGPEAAPDRRPLMLPEVFWDARPVLDHVRRAALARLAHPTAVLLVVLARVAALSSHRIRIPATVGSELGMSTLVMIAAPASAGKSIAIGVGSDLLPCEDHMVRDRIPPGSGEGLIELLYGTRKVPDDKGKPQNVRALIHHNVFAVVDEGTILAELSERSGSTLGSTLRTIYTHGTVGQANASKDKHRIAHGDQYVYGLVAGIQPELAGDMFTAKALASGGTQRFLWALPAGEELEDDPPEWPGPIQWTPPGSPTETDYLELPAEVVAEVRANRLAEARTVNMEPIDAHGMLRRLKVAGLLAMLDERLEVTFEDWHLAEILNDLSQAAMCRVRDRLAEVARSHDDAQTARQDRREATLEETATVRAERRAARAVGRKAHDLGECERRDLQRAPASRDMKLASFDDVLARAEAEEYITPTDDGRWKAGRVKPGKRQ